MRRTLFALLFALLFAPVAQAEERFANFALLYDLDSTDPIYCRVTGENGDPFGQPIRAAQKVKTSGSSATVVSNTASSAALADVVVGDILVFDTGVATTQRRVVVAKASSDSITVHAVVDLSAGYKFGYLKQTCGTTATDGWIDFPSQFLDKTVTLHIQQIAAVTGGINVRWECKDGYQDATAVRVYPTTSSTDCGPGTTASGYCNYTAVTTPSTTTTGGFSVQVVEPRKACRVSLDIGTSETAEAVEADNERITIGVMLSTSAK